MMKISIVLIYNRVEHFDAVDEVCRVEPEVFIRSADHIALVS